MALNIPTIDVSAGYDDGRTIESLGAACADWGFFQIVGHGVDPGLRRGFFGAMAEFFALPRAQKRALLRSEDNFWGYYDRELTKNKVDAKEIFDIDANLERFGDPAAQFPTPWPDQLPGLQPLVREWLVQCEGIGRQLLEGICLTLGQSPATLNPFFLKDHTSFLRFNFYPSTSGRDARPDRGVNPDEPLGIHPHTDAGALTVLAQDSVPGLQVRKDDTWHTVIPEPDGFIINVGDMIQVWSNDRFIAPEHRVLASAKEPRYSAPYFYNPSYETVCRPLTDEASSKYRPVSWREFRSGRAAGDYADHGEEIQISWYRTQSN